MHKIFTYAKMMPADAGSTRVSVFSTALSPIIKLFGIDTAQLSWTFASDAPKIW